MSLPFSGFRRLRWAVALAVLGLLSASWSFAAFPMLGLKPINVGQLHSPTVITYAPDGSGRLFVCDQPGKIYVIQGGSMLPTPFLDITSIAVTQTENYSERGLLGLAFHPGFADSGSPGYGKFYINYNKPYVAGVDPGPSQAGDPVNCVTVIAEFQVSAGDPNIADAGSERRLLMFTQPQSNHNGGQLEFGPDGYLYIAAGDGGDAQDNRSGHTGGSETPKPTSNLGNGQDKTRLLGKILRIDPLDPDGAGPLTYGIPTGNPFYNDPTPGIRKEIYAYGLRNPWRFSFDKRPGGTNRLFCGDVGQGRTEEINLIVSGGNYGWRYLEGTEMPAFSSGATTDPMQHPGGTLIDPIAMYAHPGANVGDPPLPQLGFSVTGGYVYRGAAIPALVGKYVFGDYGTTGGASDGRMMGLEETSPGSGVFTLTQAIPLFGGNPIVGQRILTLGEDESGEIYVGLKSNAGVLQLNAQGQPAGGIYQLVAPQRIVSTVVSSKDNTIFSEDLDSTRTTARGYLDASDGLGYLYVGRTGPTYGPYVRRALVQFDLASRVASGSIVQSVAVQMNLAKNGANGSGKAIDLRRVTEAWGEGTSMNELGGYGAPATTNDATWRYRLYNSATWTSNGGSFNSTASATVNVGNPGIHTWTSTAPLVADVQGWVDVPANNFGWLLLGNEVTNQTACQFDSKDSGSIPPKLVVTYDSADAPVVLAVPADIVVPTAQASVVVNYSASAYDRYGGPLAVQTDHASGSSFPIGTTVVNLSANDGLGNTAIGSFSVTVQDTAPPSLTLPDPITAEATSPNGATVNFNITTSDTASTPVLSVVPPSGSTFPFGQTTVNVTSTDGSGNMTSGSFTVTVQDTTKPSLTLPDPIVAEATSANGAAVTFDVITTDAASTPMLSVAPPSGSTFPLGQTTVNVTSTDDVGNMTSGSFTVTVQDTTKPELSLPGSITAEATGPSGAVVTFNVTTGDAVSAPNLMVNPASGSSFPLGTTMVNVTSTDAANNVATGNFSVTVQDTTKPAISGDFPPHTTSDTTIADYRSQATVTDIVGVASFTQNPAPGAALALGPNTVTLTARDTAGNEASVSFTVTRYPPVVDHERRFTTGDDVPGAGTPGGAPDGATFTGFGVPALNDAGQLAFLAKWNSPSGPGSGIFAGSPPVLIAQTGADVPDASPATFKSFMDPVIDSAGHVAFLATLGGQGVATSTRTAVMTNAFSGTLEIVARQGAAVSVAGTPKIKRFREISLVGGEVLFTGTLAGGSPAARRTNDDVAFRVASSGAAPELVVREGDPFGVSRIKAFRLLDVVAGSAGQNRNHQAGTASFFVMLADRSHALVNSAGGVVTKYRATGDATGGTGLPEATFATFGPIATDTLHAAFVASLTPGTGGVASTDARGVFLGDGAGVEPIARQTGPAGDIADAFFSSFYDPVLAPGTQRVAFTALFKGAQVKRTDDLAVFHFASDGMLHKVAREGEHAPGTPDGVRWKGVVSLALPAGDTGPLFHATLAGPGVRASNDAGVWAVNSDGDVVLLFREGDPVGDKTLKRFTALNAVPGSTGVTRSFNNHALVAWRAEFTDRKSAIVVTSVP